MTFILKQDEVSCCSFFYFFTRSYEDRQDAALFTLPP